MKSIEVAAFPAALADVAESLARELGPGALPHTATDHAIDITLDGAALSVPYRVYYNPAQLLLCTRRPGVRGLVAQCLGTRHYDGFVREQCARALLRQHDIVRIPFLVQLLGEYVLEIALPIEASLSGPFLADCARYLNGNLHYAATLQRRVVSYWDCYYRRQYPVLADYPAMQAMQRIDAARTGRRPLDRQAFQFCG